MSKIAILTISAILAAGSVQPANAAGPVAEVKEGNILFRPAHGGATQLTQSGRDSDPVLSPDGRWIVFTRSVPGKKIATGSGDADAEELWQIGVDGKNPTLLVAPRDAQDMHDVIANFSNVQFSADGRQVYFVTQAYATSGAVHVVDTTHRKEHFVVAGGDLEVIRSGEYRDCLLVMQHRYFIGGGSFDWFWLFQPDGKELGPVGEDAANFKELFCQDEKEAGKDR